MIELSTLEHADMVSGLVQMRDRIDAMLATLLPSGDAKCAHQDVEDLSTMDEEKYRCKRCGLEQATPFLTVT